MKDIYMYQVYMDILKRNLAPRSKPKLWPYIAKNIELMIPKIVAIRFVLIQGAMQPNII